MGEEAERPARPAEATSPAEAATSPARDPVSRGASSSSAGKFEAAKSLKTKVSPVQDLDQGVGGRGVAGLGGQDRGIAGQDRVQAAADQGRGILLLQWLGALQVCQKRRRNSSAMVN